MTDQAAVDWPTCDEPGCIGIRLPRGGKCLAHATARQRKAAFKRLGETGQIDARGVPLTEVLLQQVLAAAPHDTADKPTFTEALFNQATFQADAWFDRVTFQAIAWFGGATFHDVAWFREATFRAYAGFDRAIFRADARFDEAIFQANVAFGETTFQANAWFSGAIVRRDARFVSTRFEQARQLGPLLVYGLLQLDGAHFAQLTLIEVSSRGLSCQRTRFPAGVQFRLRGAQVLLDDADLPSPSLLTGVDTLSDARLARREQRLIQAVRHLAPAAIADWSARPRLLSVQGANLAGLGVANIDLAQCRFAGAHNLDQLRFEAALRGGGQLRRSTGTATVGLATGAGRGARLAGHAVRPLGGSGLVAGLAALAVPHRVAEGGRAVPDCRAVPGTAQGREDAKDEPGAADFYYGEMEMRRHARRGRTGGASRGQVERAVLTAYWLVSGYGLRAWRALTALAVVLIAFAGLLAWKGYEDAAASPDAQPTSTTMARSGPSSSTAAPARPSVRSAPATTAPASPAASVADRSLVEALLYGARTIIGLNPTPAPDLTQFGQVLLITVRVLGPLLLGLALLALRGRVKR
jgi:hypothetical protein